MQFHHRGADLLTRSQRVFVGIDKQAHHNAGIREGFHRCFERFKMPLYIKPALGGQLLPFFRHQAHLRGQNIQGNFDEGFNIGHLQVEREGLQFLQAEYIVVLNVTAVFAQVGRDAVCPRTGTVNRRIQGVGINRSARLPQGCDVIDINTKLHSFLRSNQASSDLILFMGFDGTLS